MKKKYEAPIVEVIELCLDETIAKDDSSSPDGIIKIDGDVIDFED